MTLYTRNISKKLVALQLLSYRMTLNESQGSELTRLKQGYLGELNFDEWLAHYGDNNWIILKDIFIKVDSAVSQIDTIVITPSNIYVIDIKNYFGNYRLENGGWCIGTNRLITTL